MKKFVRYFFLIVLLIVIGAYIYYHFLGSEADNAFRYQGLKQYYPEVPYEANEYIEHTAYHLSYNENHEQANWVVYLLAQQRLEGRHVERSNSFKKDEAVSTQSASTTDYLNSGYDRGHLAPAADMRFSEKAMRESFFMSNISPQNPSFNRGSWRKLENLVRNWAAQEDSLIVVVGPVFDKKLPEIGKNEVAVPQRFFKVMLDITPPNHKTIAFLMPNQSIDKPLREYAISVDELEAVTGYDFFARLPDKVIEPLEKVMNTAKWNFPAD